MNSLPFGRYEVLKKLSVGGATEVWHARLPGRDGEASRELVLKLLLPHLGEEPPLVEAFKREALIAGNMNHPNIARIYEFGQVGSNHYIAREFIAGGTAGDVLRRSRSRSAPVPPALALRVMSLACEGLHHVHTLTDPLGRDLKLVHLDVHLDTLLLGFDGAVKWIGFGRIPGALPEAVAHSYLMEGTLRMAPEQIRNKAVDHRTDVFALGRMLYELLTGERPFKRDSQLDMLKAILGVELRPPSTVAHLPSGLDPIVVKAMAREPADRYSSARELQQELERFMAEQRWEATAEQLGQWVAGLLPQR
ncbi:MAG TPA: serine/threonine-protein kinase, partial [Myxococcaceae bacterium]|jgi:serine/threonine protein kinase